MASIGGMATYEFDRTIRSKVATNQTLRLGLRHRWLETCMASGGWLCRRRFADDCRHVGAWTPRRASRTSLNPAELTGPMGRRVADGILPITDGNGKSSFYCRRVLVVESAATVASCLSSEKIGCG